MVDGQRKKEKNTTGKKGKPVKSKSQKILANNDISQSNNKWMLND